MWWWWGREWGRGDGGARTREDRGGAVRGGAEGAAGGGGGDWGCGYGMVVRVCLGGGWAWILAPSRAPRGAVWALPFHLRPPPHCCRSGVDDLRVCVWRRHASRPRLLGPPPRALSVACVGPAGVTRCVPGVYASGPGGATSGATDHGRRGRRTVRLSGAAERAHAHIRRTYIYGRVLWACEC